MAELENVLKNEQMDWLKTMVHEKDDLKSKLEDIVETVDKFLAIMEEKAEKGELDGAQMVRLNRMKQVRVNMGILAAEKEAAAETAVEEAEGAQAKADGAAHTTEQDISKLSWTAEGLTNTTEKSVQELQDEMRSETSTRNTAMNEEREATV